MKCSDFTILIGEDNPSEQKIYQKALSRAGYKLIMAESGAEILDELKNSMVDLLITDLEMKPMSGLDAISRVKRKYPALPVIVVSGYYEGMVDNFNEEDIRIDAFLHKPISLPAFKQKIREVLNINK